MAPPRVGIVGTGFGLAQIAGFRAAGFNVTAVCAAHAEHATAAAKQHDVPTALTNVTELARRDDVDIVSVASPPMLHRDHVLAVLAAGKHVICEKPFARDTGEARKMLAAAERARVVHAVDHEFRFTAARTRVKQLLDDRAIGDVRLCLVMHMVTAGERPPRPAWWLRRDRAGGLLGAVGSHWIDTLRWWLGDVGRVSCELGTTEDERPTAEGRTVRATADDTAQLLLRMRSGTIATIQLSQAVHHPSRRVILYGAEGTIVVGGDGRVLVARLGGAFEQLLADAAPGETSRAFAELARRVRAHIEAGPGGSHEPDHPTFRDGLRVQEVMDAAHRSAEGDGAVAVAS